MFISALSESAPAILIAVTLFPSPAPALVIRIVRGARGSFRIRVRIVLYSSDARQFVVSNGNSGDLAPTFRGIVRTCASVTTGGAAAGALNGITTGCAGDVFTSLLAGAQTSN